MAHYNNTTPLIALNALVIDTETTGLDPAKARIVEIGCVGIAAGQLDEANVYRRLVHPGEAIPIETTRIHNIADSDVASAPRFKQVWPELNDLIAGSVVVGHSIGFDLAVIKRECQRAGIEWKPPRTLDTRLLAEIAQRNLSGYSLDHLASWLGVDAEGRHSAVADAIITGKIFLALLPKLREGNIRTLAEAEQACLALTNLLDDQHRAGWEDPVLMPSRREVRTFARIDPYPYRHRISDVMSSPPKVIAATTTLDDALGRMARDRISSLLVTADAERPMTARNTGIVTERDVLRALAEKGPDALAMAVGSFASKPLVALPKAAFVYRALGRMSRLGLRHLGVEGDDGEICGIVTSRDLLRLRAQEATILGDAIDQADDVASLGIAWSHLPQAAAALLDEGIGGRDIASVISRELGALTRRAGVLAERRMVNEGRGQPPCDYALCVLGSAGRGESLLALDQDNALVFTEGEPGGAADQWFAQFGSIVADILHEVGVPYCNGGVMAKNSQWRGSLATWQARVADWISRSNPADLLSVDIFFDMVSVLGTARLANEIWRFGFDTARGNAAFAKLLADAAGKGESSITLFGGIRTEQGRIDLKRAGLFGIVTMGRVLAIRHHVLERATPARLDAIAAMGHGRNDLAALSQAQSTFLDRILRQQLVDIGSGMPPSNKVAVKRLTASERAQLKTALSAVGHIETLARDLLF